MSPLSKSLPQPSILVSLHLYLYMVSLSYLVSFLFLFPACNYIFIRFGLPHQTVSSLKNCSIVLSKFDTWVGWLRYVLKPTAQHSIFCQKEWCARRGGKKLRKAFASYSVRMGRISSIWEGGRGVPDKGNMNEHTRTCWWWKWRKENWARKGLDSMAHPADRRALEGFFSPRGSEARLNLAFSPYASLPCYYSLWESRKQFH